MLPKHLSVTTKAEDIGVTLDGRFVSSPVLTHTSKPMADIERAQIVQQVPDRLTVRIMRRASYTEPDTRQLMEGLHTCLGPEMRIDLLSRVPLRLGSASENLFREEDRPR